MRIRHFTPIVAAGIFAACSNSSGTTAPATRLALIGLPPAVAQSGVVLTLQPEVQLVDAGGNPVAQAQVPVTVTIDAGGGTLGGGPLTVNTNANGVAIFAGLTITGIVGSRTLRFTATVNGSAASVSAGPIALNAGPAALLAVITQPAPVAQSGVVLAVQPSVQLQDLSGNPAAQAGLLVRVLIASGGGALGGGPLTISTDANGAATFSGLSITGVVGSRTLQFTTLNSVTVTSAAITLTAGPAAQLVLTTQPALFAQSGVTLTPQPTVQIEDAAGNPVGIAAVPVAVSVTAGGSTVGGTVAVNSNALGQAIFTNLSLSGGAGSVTLTFAALVNGSTFVAVTSGVIALGPWATKVSMPTPRGNVAVGVVNGVLYAVGGSGSGGSILGTVEAYDPATGAWTTKAPMPTPRYGLAVGVVNGILYAVGGSRSADGLNALGTVEAYDPATNSWTTKTPMPTPRVGLAVGVVNGIMYAVAGITTDYVATVEAYDPATNSWTTRAPTSAPRGGLAIGVVSGILYAVGGISNLADLDVLGTLEAYDPIANSWTTRASMPTPRTGLAVGVANGIMYAVGGLGPTGADVGTVEAYDPAAGSWTTRTPMPTAREAFAVGVVNNVLYAVGGTNSLLGTLGGVEAFLP